MRVNVCRALALYTSGLMVRGNAAIRQTALSDVDRHPAIGNESAIYVVSLLLRIGKIGRIGVDVIRVCLSRYS